MTIYHNYHITDILKYVRLMYSMLKEGGIWIDVCTANFSSNVIPMSYKEYETVLLKSQFKLLEKRQSEDYWYEDQECIMK